MWSLTNVKTGLIYYITPCQDAYIVGRNNADIVILDDNSISRIHANLKLNAKNKLELVDCESKYGTYIIDQGIGGLQKVKVKTPIVLKSNDQIVFGCKDSKWTVTNTIFKTVVSTLSENIKSELSKTMSLIKGSTSNEFTDTCTHLTMPMLSITMKVLLSLSGGIPIVTPEYWREFVKCIQGKQKLIDYRQYLPPINETFLRTSELNFDINTMRKTLFAGKRFIFMLSHHMARYELLIRKAGGTCKHLGEKLSKSEIIKSDAIVIQYVASGLTQTPHSQSLSDCEKVYDIIKKMGKRPIPDVEIGLAIIYCSLEKYCNPEFKVITTENISTTTNNLQTSTLLAIDTPTESSSKDSKQFTASCEIPDSELIKKHLNVVDVNINDKQKAGTALPNLNVMDVDDLEATQKFIMPETTNTSSKRKNDDNTESSKNKRINLEDDIDLTPSQYKPLEDFLAKKPNLTKPPAKSVAATKRNLSSRINDLSDTENDDGDLFSFKKPAKKSKQATEVANDNPFLDGEFNFKRKTRLDRSSASQSSLASSCLFVTQNTLVPLPNDSVDGQRNIKFFSNDTQGSMIDLSDYIKPVNVNTGQWLSRELVKSMNITQSETAGDDTLKDIKPNETDLFVESMKSSFKVENTAIVLNNSENVYYHQNLKDCEGNSKNTKNFKAFKKIFNYKKSGVILNCVPVVV